MWKTFAGGAASSNDMQPEDIENTPKVNDTAIRDNDLLRCIEQVTAGNYSVRPVGNDDVSIALDKFIQNISENLQQDMTHVVDISVQANETAIFSAHMLSNLKKVDDQAHGIASAAEEMVATVQEIGSYGQNIAEKAQEAQQVTESGSQASRDAISGMEKIVESVNQSVKKADILTEFSERIGVISEDIKAIADQTNLLALNATIEAARAGEAGRGFAVVAEEVKSLSGQTTKSTEEVNSIILNLREETKEILSSLDDSRSAALAGQDTIEVVSSRMSEINEKISEVTHNTNQIAHTLSEQKTASQEVAQGIANIASSSSESVKGIEKIVDAMDAVEGLISSQIAIMAKLEVPNKVIKLAKSDHVLWKKRLANMVVGREGLNPDELADHHTCRLGKWYDAVTEEKYKNNPVFIKLVEPHKLVHEHGIKAAKFFNDGKMQECLAEIDKVERASKDVLRMLGELE